MKHRWLLPICLLLLAACAVDATPPAPINRQTANAPTPQPTAAPPTATVEPTATATAVPVETVAPSEETTTAVADPGQALVDVSYCRRTFGSGAGAQFSARLSEIRAADLPQFEQLTFVFTDTDGLLHGTAACMFGAAWPTAVSYGSTDAPGQAMIALHLDDWLHDDLFAASPLTQTMEITPSGILERVAFAADPLESRGAILGIGLGEPHPFRVRVEDNELIVEVARSAVYPPANDPLGEEAGAAPESDRPVFFLKDGDVYRLEAGRAQPVVETPELEIGLAVSPDGTLLAVCRAAADVEPFALPYDVRATLWVMQANGSDPRQLADIGGCAEPVFAASGKTIAFTANVAASPPAVLQVFTLPVVGGEVTAATNGIDEWSRFQPRWLPDGRLVYRARNDSGQNSIYVRETDGDEREITAQLLTGAEYRGVGDFVVDPVDGLLAIEALHAADDGADLVVLRPDGTQVAAEKRGFWQRPLAFTSAGLIYLTAQCPSETVLSYTVHRRSPQGTIEALAAGDTNAAIGAAAVVGDTLLYVRTPSEATGVRGAYVEPEPDDVSTIWAMSSDGTNRAELWAADAAVTGLQVATQ
ncbi:MAG TPA: hypothetical protein VFZ66_08540 [Herpetosiphonaceae bacterium]